MRVLQGPLSRFSWRLWMPFLAFMAAWSATPGACAEPAPDPKPAEAKPAGGEKIAADTPEVKSAALYQAGLALQKQEKIAEAVAKWDEALKTDPKNWACLNHYAWFLAVTAPEKHPDRADAKRALELATKSAELTGWKNRDVLDTVAECHFVLKDYEKAVATQLMALAGGTTGHSKESYLREQLAKFEAAAKK